MNALITVLAFIFALALLIIVHELGHYFVARLCNVKVLRFSVGFGRAIVSRRFGPDSTEWALAVFPIGGYVKMLDEHEGEVAAAELPRAFNRQHVARRMAIVTAGPAANFLLAILLYWGVFIHGFPGSKPVIGGLAAGSPAAAAQFAVGETLLSIGGEPVVTWQDARWMLLKHAMEKTAPRIEAQNARGEIALRRLDLSQLRPEDLDADFLDKLGFTRLRPALPPLIGRVLPGGAAERGGLRGGDEIVVIDGAAVTRWDEVVKIVSENPERRLEFMIRRDGAIVGPVSVTPERVRQGDRESGRIGAAPNVDQAALEQYVVHVRYGPIAALGKALEKTWDTSAFTLKMIGKMLVGEVSLKNLSGPITIADYAGQSAQVGGISYVLFLTLISISLGVLNLLPIPLLDGGHLMYYTVEIVKGSPVSQTAMEVGQQVGMGVLLVLMAFALYNDFARLLYG